MATQKSVLITGAATGLGYHLCEEFIAADYVVFALTRKPLAQHAGIASKVIPILGDISQEGIRDSITQVLSAHTDRLDFLINNAGIKGGATDIASVDSADIELLLQTHCLGAIRCVQAALPYLKKSNSAAIVNVSSRMGSIELMNAGEFDHLRTSYAMRISKAALNMFSACLGRELKDTSIAVHTIHPGQLTTKMGHRDAADDPALAAKKLKDWLISSPPGGSFTQPFEKTLPW